VVLQEDEAFGGQPEVARSLGERPGVPADSSLSDHLLAGAQGKGRLDFPTKAADRVDGLHYAGRQWRFVMRHGVKDAIPSGFNWRSA
jgi:hypothetical protein